MELTNHKKGKDFWGLPIWTTFHIFAATFKPEHKNIFLLFIKSVLTTLLPCEECRRNLKKKLDKYPPEKYLTNNHDAFFYSYLIHDLANIEISRKTKKEISSPPFDEVKAYYFEKLTECKECQL